MTVHGTDLWFSLTTGATQSNQLLVAGTGSGASFTTYQSPCFAGLAGSIQATSASVVWSACPTGMLAEAFRSTDGGAQWKPLSALGEIENSALLSPASDTAAVLQPSSGQLMRTEDGGATWKTVAGSPGGGTWTWIGFTDSNTGSGLLAEANIPANWPWPKGPSPEELWRTSDGGATWSGPVNIGP